MNCGGKKQKDIDYNVRSLENGYESVLEAFKRGFENGEEAAQLAVFHKGNKVVDICGKIKTRKYEKYNIDSMQVCFSTGKTIAAFVVGWLVDQGKLNYDEKISTYWPEFAQNGKEDILLEHLMRHEAGLPFLEAKITLDLIQPANYKKLIKMFEEARPCWEYRKNMEKQERVYHAATRGFVIDELCRRVDEENRTLSQLYSFLNGKVNETLGVDNVAVHLGNLDEEAMKKVFIHSFKNPIRNQVKLIFKLMCPFSLANDDKYEMDEEIIIKKKALKKEAKDKKKSNQGLHGFNHVYSKNHIYPSAETYQIEGSSFNTVSSAVSLASFAKAMVLEKENRIISEETVDLMLSEPSQRFDLFPYDPTTFTKGGHGLFKEALYPEYVHELYGWQGFGGSICVFSKKYDLSVSYIPNRKDLTTFGGFFSDRCLHVMETLMSIVRE